MPELLEVWRKLLEASLNGCCAVQLLLEVKSKQGENGAVVGPPLLSTFVGRRIMFSLGFKETP
jgi:hypothetical protein